MDKPVFDYGIAELLAMAPHYAAPPDICPKTRALSDQFNELVWNTPPDKRAALLKICEDFWAASAARRQQRVDEEWRP